MFYSSFGLWNHTVLCVQNSSASYGAQAHSKAHSQQTVCFLLDDVLASLLVGRRIICADGPDLSWSVVSCCVFSGPLGGSYTRRKNGNTVLHKVLPQSCPQSALVLQAYTLKWAEGQSQIYYRVVQW